jgi:hypothetical protein
MDGVLRKRRNQDPIFEGMLMYRALNEFNRVIAVTDNKDQADVWFKTKSLVHKIDDIFELEDKKAVNPGLRAVEVLRSRGKVDLVVTDSADLAKDLLEVGVPVTVFLSPQYARPEFRPDGRPGVKSWAAITAEMDRQQGLYMDDVRISDENITLSEDDL